MKLVTVLYLTRPGEILLAMKKRGFGKGKWNGTGGKAEPGETMLQAAIRECEEEIGVTPRKPRLVAKIDFREQNDPSFGHFAFVYIADNWQGEPIETEEMRPQWFRTDALPFEQMWADDPLWLPLVLQGQLFTATFTMNGNRVTSHDIQKVEALHEDT
jgi:mutator protein MutT